MWECTIADTKVKFPFEPYEVQCDYMEKVILCLRDSTNGALESPSGTGKTLSLLCSSLAWLLAKKEELKTNKSDDCKVPKIIYASRTHSQLVQAAKELKRTAYSSMKAVVLGSRDQLCIHPEVMKETISANKIHMCKSLTKPRKNENPKCTYFSGVESIETISYFCASSIMDIEDLVKVGQTHKICPYYAAKQLVEEVDIVFMPYNYLFGHFALQANEIQMSNAICILDEAHNIEKICEESASAEIKSIDVAMAVEDIIQVLDVISTEKIYVDIKQSDLLTLKETLLKLGNCIDNIEVKEGEGETFSAEYIFKLLAQANIDFCSSQGIVVVLDTLVELLAIETEENKKHLSKVIGFQKLSKFLSTVFNCDEESMDKVNRSFKVHVNVPIEGYRSTNVNYLCLNPGFSMEQLLRTNPRSVILTSCTLSPLKPLLAELGLTVSQRLSNADIMQSSQIYCKIITSGPCNIELNSTYNNRDNLSYILSLGRTILNVARVVPHGLLVFFPSYSFLHQCEKLWKSAVGKGLWKDIFHYKEIFIEPKENNDFIMIMKSFKERIADSKGACLMGVCRGKMSEGVDFIDRNCRAVIIAGFPLPPRNDPKIVSKRIYLNEKFTEENGLPTGSEWYTLQAIRAVNLAIGRVIRHRNDYGAILLCDSRFQRTSIVNQMSEWVRQRLGSKLIDSEVDFDSAVSELKDFFENKMAISQQHSNKDLKNEHLEDVQEIELPSCSSNVFTATAGQSLSTSLDLTNSFANDDDSVRDTSSVMPSCSSSSSQNLVKINKREHSPLSQSALSRSSNREAIDMKKRKVEQSVSPTQCVDDNQMVTDDEL